MSTSSELSTITIHSLADTIVALPYQLGYRPTASLVMVCLHSAGDRPSDALTTTTRGSVVLTARIDLRPVQEHPEVLAALEPALARSDTDQVVLVAFEDDSGGIQDSGEPHDARVLLGHVATLAGAHAVTVVAQARVRGRQWTSVDPAQAAESWPELPRDADVRAVSDYVLAGRAPARDRRALAEVLVPTDEALARSVCRRLESLAQASDRVGTDRAAAMSRAAATLALVVGWTGTGPPELNVDDLVCTTLALDDVRFRDAVIQSLTRPLPSSDEHSGADEEREAHGHPGGVDAFEGWVSGELQHPGELCSSACFRLARAAAYIPATHAAAWLTLVGYLAWRVGEGALANIAIVAARRSNPDYPLAQLVELALRGAVRPPRPV